MRVVTLAMSRQYSWHGLENPCADCYRLDTYILIQYKQLLRTQKNKPHLELNLQHLLRNREDEVFEA